MNRWPTVAVTLGAVTAAATLILLGLALGGESPWAMLSAWFHGATGNQVRWALSFQEAGPLLLTGLAAAVAFRCGVLNIGGEGQYLVGAVTLVAFSTTWAIPGPGWLALPVALALAAAAAAGWALLALALERWRGVPLVLSTILLNFIAVYLVGMLVTGPLHDPTTTAPQTALIGDAYRLPVLIDGTKLHLGVVLALALALGLWIVQRRTVFGFELLVSGANPEAARLAGMPVGRRRLQAMALSGALAGLAGALQQAGVTYFMSDASTSYGYAGIAVALLGRLHPLGVVAAAVFFGMLDTGGRNVEKSLQIPHDLGDVAKGLIILAVLVGGAIQLHRRTATRPTLAAGDRT